MSNRILPSVFFILVVLMGCNSLEYSPNQAYDEYSPRDLNRKHIAKLVEAPADDTIRFVLTGDSQREYNFAKDLVKAVNRIEGLDFVLLAGDISDFGLLQEMEWVNNIFSRLKAPYIGVIGNHDLVAQGERVYERMFGELDFSFTYQGVKFVCHNTNSREAKFNGKVPDLGWLSTQLRPENGVDAWVTVAHVPPGNGDFDNDLAMDYIAVVNGSPNTLAALFAHTHSEDVFYPRQDNIPYIVTDAIEHRQFVLIEIINGKLSFENVDF